MSKLRITPIGTCRIHTPLVRAARRYPIELDLRRNYGFVHTSEEALQLLRFLQGEKSFRADTPKLISRDSDLSRYESEDWQPSDLNIVEISSAKKVTSGGDAVQLNYVQRYFSDFFANAQRNRSFWSLAKKGNRQELIDYLEKQPSYQLLSEGDRQLLSSLSMDHMSFKAIKADMSEIVDRLGADKVLFVTHVNATTADDEVLPSRDRIIRWVKLAADQLGAPVYDPTSFMEEFGQEKALEDGGLDLTHYTSTFSDRLYDKLHQSHVGALTQAETLGAQDEQQSLGMLAANLEAMLDFGDFFAASREVHSALELKPDAKPLIELRGSVRARIGDYRGALPDLTVSRDTSLLSHPMRVALLETLSHLGHHDQALEVARGLFADEFESPRIYRSAASAAEQAGQFDTAIRYLKQSYRIDRSDLPTGLRALVLLTERGDPAEATEWRQELLDTIGLSSSGSFEMASWALKHGDQDLFIAAFNSIVLSDKAGSIDLLEDAYNAGMIRAVAHSIPLTAELGRLSTSLGRRRAALIDGALAGIESLFQSGRTAEAYTLAQAIARLSDISNSQLDPRALSRQAQKLIRIITRQVRLEVRTAFSERDLHRVVELGAAAGHALVGDPDTATIVARALHDVGHPEDALELLVTALAANPDNLNVLRWAGRYGATLGDFATAFEAYRRLKGLDTSKLPAIQTETDRFFVSAERRALKRVRELALSERYEEALRIVRIMNQVLGPLDRTERELKRIRAALRVRLREIESGEGDTEDREQILRQLVEVRPSDQSTLRRMAVELMRQSRFAEATDYWERLLKLDPTNESANRNRVRCATLARRRAGNSGQLL